MVTTNLKEAGGKHGAYEQKLHISGMTRVMLQNKQKPNTAQIVTNVNVEATSMESVTLTLGDLILICRRYETAPKRKRHSEFKRQ